MAMSRFRFSNFQTHRRVKSSGGLLQLCQMWIVDQNQLQRVQSVQLGGFETDIFTLSLKSHSWFGSARIKMHRKY